MCGWFLWSANMFNNYMLGFYVKYFPGNIFINSMYFALADIFAYVLSGVIIKRVAIKKSFFIIYAIMLSGSVFYLFFFWYDPLVPVFIMLSEVGVSMSFNVMYCTNKKLYPIEF